MENKATPLREYFPCDICDFAPRARLSRCNARHASSHVDFCLDVPQIPEHHVNHPRRNKRRAKPRHCPSCHCQENHRRINDWSLENECSVAKNDFGEELKKEQRQLDKSDTVLTELSDEGSKFRRRNRRAGSSSSPFPARNQTHRSRTLSHCHIPGNNPPGTVLHPRKYENYTSQREFTIHDSSAPRGDTVNSGFASGGETDITYEQHHSRNQGSKDLNFRRASTPDRAEMENDSKHFTLGITDSKKRHSREGYENVEKICSNEDDESKDEDDEDGKVSIETGSSVVKDEKPWDEQYQRDRRELDDLTEDLRKFENKRKTSGVKIAEGKKQPNDNKLDEDQEIGDKIYTFISKIPYESRTTMPDDSCEKCTKNPNSRTGVWTPKIDAGKRRNESINRIEGGTETKSDQRTLYSNRRSPGIKRANALMQLENSSLDADEQCDEATLDPRSRDAGSETEEEARELLKVQKTAGNIDNSRAPLAAFNQTKNTSWEEKNSDTRNKGLEKRAHRRGMGDETPEIQGKLEHCETVMKVEARSREMRERMYERAISILNFPPRKMSDESPLSGLPSKSDDPAMGKSTKTCIQRTIDGSLSCEKKQQICGLFSGSKKDLSCGESAAKRVLSKRSTNDDAKNSKFHRCECFSNHSTENREALPIETSSKAQSAIKCADTHRLKSKKIPEEFRDESDYVKKLKNRRWDYLNNIQNDLAKLYDIEKFLDSCTQEDSSRRIKL